jgi:hypothetical protein
VQFFEFLANAVLLYRAFKLYKAGEPYVQLNEETGEEEAVVVVRSPSSPLHASSASCRPARTSCFDP